MAQADLAQFEMKRLEHSDVLKPFVCGNDDLDDFYHNEAIAHLSQLLTVTYIYENGDKAGAFFSVQNDSLNKSNSSNGTLKRIKKTLPIAKRYAYFPAVKIGRLGVHIDYQGKTVGTQILDFIKAFFTRGNKTGCRFIIVDAYNYPSIINFYTKNGFDFLSTKDIKDTTRTMYFDLIRFIR